MRVVISELDYTGGGIWCAWGVLDDGTVFCGSDNFSFIIYPTDVLKLLNDDVTIYDIDPCDCHPLRFTGEEGEEAIETYDIWSQVYDAHPDCVDIDALRRDLAETYKRNIELDFTLGELKNMMFALESVSASNTILYRKIMNKLEEYEC